jgi:hypothetical protein
MRYVSQKHLLYTAVYEICHLEDTTEWCGASKVLFYLVEIEDYNKICKTLISYVLYGCETWSHTLKEKCGLSIVEQCAGDRESKRRTGNMTNYVIFT